MRHIGRLAPSSSGELHLGNLLAFVAAWLSIRQKNGTLLLRVEDIDALRCKAHFERQIRSDLHWLGLLWDKEVPAQSTRSYTHALTQLNAHTFYCECTRRQVRARCPGGYDGHCFERHLQRGALRYRAPAVRPITDRAFGPCLPPKIPQSPILQRADGAIAYTLAVVADDIADEVTEVVRGSDLLGQSPLQETLWRTLQHAPPSWCHCPTLFSAPSEKLSKSQRSLSIRALREAGWSANALRVLCFRWLGLDGVSSLNEATRAFSPTAFPSRGILIANMSESTVNDPLSVHWKCLSEPQ